MQAAVERRRGRRNRREPVVAVKTIVAIEVGNMADEVLERDVDLGDGSS